MIIDDVEYFPVTDDADALSALHAKEPVLGSSELGQYAAEELGLTPPRRTPDGSTPAIVLVWDQAQGRGVLVWDIHELPEADPDDDFDESGSGWT